MADHKALIVPDASVLLKWAVKEKECLAEALRLREDFRLEKVDMKVPAHCFAEICNMLGREQQKAAVSFVSYLIVAGIEECCLNLDVASTAFKLMDKYCGITFYDAVYHALAINENGIFLTADEKYFRKAGKEGHIMLLKHYGKKR